MKRQVPWLRLVTPLAFLLAGCERSMAPVEPSESSVASSRASTETVARGGAGVVDASAPTISVAQAQDIESLIGEIVASSLRAGSKNSLTSKLNAALASLARQNSRAAANQLRAFIHEVEAMQRSGRLDDATASRWIAAAEQSLDPPSAAVLDQQQLVYNGGASARTLPGYYIWQSFTVGISGILTEIDMGFFNDMSGSGLLEIFAGQGTTGQLLQALVVPVIGITQTPVTWNAWMVNVPVTAGSVYTFKFTPDAATLPDPYGVAIGFGNLYPGGGMGFGDPTNFEPDFDMVFRTFVR